MSWELEEDKKWNAKPIWAKLGYTAACLGLGLILLPLAILASAYERIRSIEVRR